MAKRYKITIIAALLGLAMWLSSAGLEWLEIYLHHHSQPSDFYGLLISHPSPKELFIRFLTLYAFIVFGFYIDHYINKIRQSEKKLKDSGRQLRMLSAQLLNIQESERSRISKELHDGLGQSVMLLQFQLSAIYKKFEDQALRHELDSVLAYLDDVIGSIRRLTKDLSPALLENFGLSVAVRFLIEDFSKGLHIESVGDIEDVDHLLSPQFQLHIYRIFQEALTNIGKHAQAKQISSVMKQQGDHIYIEIKDDGKGFDLKEAQANPHKARKFGLDTMTERAHLIGGTLNLESRQGTGTRIAITVPPNPGGADEAL